MAIGQGVIDDQENEYYSYNFEEDYDEQYVDVDEDYDTLEF